VLNVPILTLRFLNPKSQSAVATVFPAQIESDFHDRFGDENANQLEDASPPAGDPAESLNSPFQCGRFLLGTAFFRQISPKTI
jgi:hypothetical protein